MVAVQELYAMHQELLSTKRGSPERKELRVAPCSLSLLSALVSTMVYFSY